MARWNKVTGKIESLAGRDVSRSERRLSKLAARTKITGKDIKRKLQEDASEDDRDEDKGEGEKIQKKTTPVESKEDQKEMEDDIMVDLENL